MTTYKKKKLKHQILRRYREGISYEIILRRLAISRGNAGQQSAFQGYVFAYYQSLCGIK